MSQIRKALALTFLSTNGATAVQFAVTLVLARLLSPEEIGIFSITAVAVSIAQLFRDFGVASYLQREADLTRQKVATAFGVLLFSSWVIALLVFLVSGPLARFYGQAGVQDVMQVLALGFVFIPFGAVTHNLLTRDYRAKEQAYVRVAGTSAYAITSIGLAMMGHGYMSMAWANLVNIIVTALAYWPFRPATAAVWPSLKGWRSVVNFGAAATLGNSANAINNALPDIVLGKISGPYDVGLLSRGTAITNLLNQVIGPTVSYAVLPLLSRVHHSGQALSGHLAKASSYITGLMWPALVGTALFAEPLIRFLYGPQWVAAAEPVQWLALMLALMNPFTFHGTAFIALGRPMLAVWPTLAMLLARGVAIFWVYDGTLVSFALALCLAAVGVWPIQLWMQSAIIGLRAQPFVRALVPSAIVTLLCSVSALAVQALTQGHADGVILMSAFVLVGLTWLLSVWCCRHPLRQELEMICAKWPWLARRLKIDQPSASS